MERIELKKAVIMQQGAYLFHDSVTNEDINPQFEAIDSGLTEMIERYKIRVSYGKGHIKVSGAYQEKRAKSILNNQINDLFSGKVVKLGGF